MSSNKNIVTFTVRLRVACFHFNVECGLVLLPVVAAASVEYSQSVSGYPASGYATASSMPYPLDSHGMFICVGV